MQRRTIPILAALLLVGLVATPAAADRDPFTANFPHGSYALVTGELFGQPDVRELPTGEWAIVGAAGWGTMTAAQRDHFLETAVVEVYLDGVPQSNIGLYLLEGGQAPYEVWFGRAEPPGAANSEQVWMTRVTFTEDHFDGWDIYPAGTVFEDDRTIHWTPRGQFPSGDYPPSEF